MSRILNEKSKLKFVLCNFRQINIELNTQKIAKKKNIQYKSTTRKIVYNVVNFLIVVEKTSVSEEKCDNYGV